MVVGLAGRWAGKGRSGRAQVRASLPPSPGQRKRLFLRRLAGLGRARTPRRRGLPAPTPLMAPPPPPRPRVAITEGARGSREVSGSHGRSRVPTTPVCRGCCFPRLSGRAPRRTTASIHAPCCRAAPCAPRPQRSSGHAVLSKRKPGTRSAEPRRPGSARAPQRRGCPVGAPAPQAHIVQLRSTAAAGTRLPPDHVPRHPLAGAPSRSHAPP